MSDYNVLENTLYTIAVWGTSIPWSWEQQPDQFDFGGACGILSGPHDVANVGWDYVKVSRATGRAEVHAWRTSLVSLRIVTPNQVGVARSGWLMQNLLQALALPDVEPALQAGGLAIAAISPVRTFDSRGSSARMESISAVDLTLNWAPSALQPTTSYGVVESVTGVRIIDSGAPVAWSVGR